MDPLANMLIAMKNAGAVGKDSVCVPFSKFSAAVAHKLFEKGFIAAHSKKDNRNNVQAQLEIELKYHNDSRPRIQQVKRISKLSRRVYKGVKEIYSVKQGQGLLLLSTPKGVMTGDEAKAAHVGGEVLFEIW